MSCHKTYIIVHGPLYDSGDSCLSDRPYFLLVIDSIFRLAILASLCSTILLSFLMTTCPIQNKRTPSARRSPTGSKTLTKMKEERVSDFRSSPYLSSHRHFCLISLWLGEKRWLFLFSYFNFVWIWGSPSITLLTFFSHPWPTSVVFVLFFWVYFQDTSLYLKKRVQLWAFIFDETSKFSVIHDSWSPLIEKPKSLLRKGGIFTTYDCRKRIKQTVSIYVDVNIGC